MNKIVIDEERCKGCYLCIETCPKHLIKIGEQLNPGGHYPACASLPPDAARRESPELTDGQCTACALCARICPDAAIEVYREVKNGALRGSDSESTV